MNERDTFIQEQVGPMLAPDEAIQYTAFMVKQPSLAMQLLLLGPVITLFMTKSFFVAVTNHRMILIRTALGMAKPKLVNRGVDEVLVSDIREVKTGGFANNRSMTFHMMDGTKLTLRIAPRSKIVSGSKTLFEELPKTLESASALAA